MLTNGLTDVLIPQACSSPVELQRETLFVGGLVQKPFFGIVLVMGKLQTVIHRDIHFFCQFGG